LVIVPPEAGFSVITSYCKSVLAFEESYVNDVTAPFGSVTEHKSTGPLVHVEHPDPL
jgi:hypothetical protein